MNATPTFATQLERYVSLLLTLGVNLQPGQNLILSSSAAPVEDVAEVMRLITRTAYEMGARNVFPQWEDAEIARTRMRLAPKEALSDVQTWRAQWLEEQSAQGSAFLSLYAPDPDLYSGIQSERIATAVRANAQANAGLSQAASRLAHPWCNASVATRVWARKVYPDLSEQEATDALWAYIFKATRIDQPDPIQAWREHLDRLGAHMDYLNGMRLRRLHYSAPGTHLTVDLPEGHLWIGGGAGNYKGARFTPNLPTEEVFSLPAREGVNGTVRSTMPLNHNGVLIDGIRLTLERGRIVSYAADSGADALKNIIETDEGAHYLGEIALVPIDSPINTGAPVYNILFDENASCHIAIGRAYPICIQGGETMTADELSAHGVNTSTMHVDFMIGSAELNIDGESASGERTPIFRNGMWAERA